MGSENALHPAGATENTESNYPPLPPALPKTIPCRNLCQLALNPCQLIWPFVSHHFSFGFQDPLFRLLLQIWDRVRIPCWLHFALRWHHFRITFSASMLTQSGAGFWFIFYSCCSKHLDSGVFAVPNNTLFNDSLLLKNNLWFVHSIGLGVDLASSWNHFQSLSSILLFWQDPTHRFCV